jgi:hypothetical protein
MELKVREVSAEEKSVQEVEQELVEKHEQELNEETGSTESVEQQNPVEEQVVEGDKPKEFGDEDVLEYIKNRYNTKNFPKTLLRTMSTGKRQGGEWMTT